MDSKNIKVLEALQMQPLSEEEKARRHILGRLWGPIATSKEKTRNGRGYNAQLWDKALKDEIFREKEGGSTFPQPSPIPQFGADTPPQPLPQAVPTPNCKSSIFQERNPAGTWIPPETETSLCLRHQIPCGTPPSLK